VIKNDVVNECIEKMVEADGIILSSPTYFTDVSPEMKNLIDRAGYVARANDHRFRRKTGAAVVAARRAGAIHTFDTLNHFFFISQIIVPGSSYWNIGMGLEPGRCETGQGRACNDEDAWPEYGVADEKTGITTFFYIRVIVRYSCVYNDMYHELMIPPIIGFCTGSAISIILSFEMEHPAWQQKDAEITYHLIQAGKVFSQNIHSIMYGYSFLQPLFRKWLSTIQQVLSHL